MHALVLAFIHTIPRIPITIGTIMIAKEKTILKDEAPMKILILTLRLFPQDRICLHNNCQGMTFKKKSNKQRINTLQQNFGHGHPQKHLTV